MKRLIALLAVVLLCATLVLGLNQRQYIRDSFVARSHELQPEASTVAERLSLTPEGERLYRASRAEVQTANDFNRSCSGVHRELTIVLGCYTQQRIYVFQVTDERLEGAVEVTAAHELLHAAYERLSGGERERLDGLLSEAAKQVTAGRLADTIALYSGTVPDHLANELHSLLGTEKAELSEELEAHYARYFRDRQEIVAFAQQYSAVFAQLEQEIKAYDAQLARLSVRKSSLEEALAGQQTALTASESQLRQLRVQDDVAAYNRAVPQHNTRVDTYNSTVRQLRDLVAEYNDIVEKRNDRAITQNSLVQTLDSKYEPVDQ